VLSCVLGADATQHADGVHHGVCRQPTLEEREYLEEEALEQERWSMIKLERLHFDGAAQ
jgi:hypothetical protein